MSPLHSHVIPFSQPDRNELFYTALANLALPSTETGIVYAIGILKYIDGLGYASYRDINGTKN